MNAYSINVRNLKGDTIMNTKQWLKTCAMALLIGSWNLPSPVAAGVLKQENLAGNCSGGCVDTWQVECKDGKTHSILAVVNDTGAEDMSFEITTMGYTGGAALVGQADEERSPSYSPYNSNGAILFRPGTTTGSTSALVLVHVFSANSAPPFAYEVEFFCRDINGGAQLKDPTIKLL